MQSYSPSDRKRTSRQSECFLVSINIQPVDHSHEIVFQLILPNRFLLHYLVTIIEVFILFNVQLNIKRLENEEKQILLGDYIRSLIKTSFIALRNEEECSSFIY